MWVPVSWLREYVRVDASVEEIAARLSVSTCEVERIVRRGVPDEDGNVGLFRVGRVLEAEKHPNADRLQLCRVDVGESEPYQIVCGAWNFGAGAKVAVALPGATLSGGLKLERRELRGQLSEGMILAEDEVDLGEDHTGIMVLDASLEPGTPLVDVLPILEDVLEVETTPNRPDLLSDLRARARGGGALRRRARGLAGDGARARPATSRSTSGSTTWRAVRGTWAGSSGTWRSGRRRRGSAPGSTSPGCARSRTSSTSRTTSCTRSGARSTRSTGI